MSTRPLTVQLQEKAKSELNENPKSVDEDVRFIRDWLEKQPHLKAKTDKQWILTFLRGSKFSLERTKEKLDMFYTMRTLLPEFFKSRDPMLPEHQEILKMGIFLPLPEPTPEGERVLLIRNGVYDPAKINTATTFKILGMIVDILLNEDDNFIIAGLQTINDLKGSTMNGLVHYSPVTIKKFLKCFQEAYPLRPKALVFLNAPSFFEMIYSLFKNFLSDKLKSRMHIITGETVNLSFIPKSILPKDYGGESESVRSLTEHWKKKVESYRDWFREDEQYYSIESKRPGKPKTPDAIFGVEGSFRKLDVD